MSRKSIVLLPNTSDELNVTGDKVIGDSYLGFTDGLHTIAIYLNNFTGRVFVQATLATDPQEEDWFDINLITNQFSNEQFVQFPLDPNNPTGTDGDTGVEAFTFIGNFVFLRAGITRDYLGVPDATGLGSVRKILLSL
jgi:hypothetical protein